MTLYDVKKTKDGGFETTSRRLTKQIVVNNQIVTMVSLDGSTWVLEQNEAREQRRIQGGINLHGARWAKTKKKDFDARINPGKVKAAVPPMLEYTDSSFLGKDQGKQQKYRRNLRRKKEKLPKIAKPVHFHTCRGVFHPKKYDLHEKEYNTKFICACDKPRTSRFCGPNFCLYD